MMMSRDDNNVNGLFGPHSLKSSKLVLIGASHRCVLLCIGKQIDIQYWL